MAEGFNLYTSPRINLRQRKTILEEAYKHLGKSLNYRALTLIRKRKFYNIKRRLLRARNKLKVDPAPDPKEKVEVGKNEEEAHVIKTRSGRVVKPRHLE